MSCFSFLFRHRPSEPSSTFYVPSVASDLVLRSILKPVGPRPLHRSKSCSDLPSLGAYNDEKTFYLRLLAEIPLVDLVTSEFDFQNHRPLPPPRSNLTRSRAPRNLACQLNLDPERYYAYKAISANQTFFVVSEKQKEYFSPPCRRNKGRKNKVHFKD